MRIFTSTQGEGRMLTIHVRDKDGAPVFARSGGRPVTITLGTPGTFPSLPMGPAVEIGRPRRMRKAGQPTRESIEKLTDYVVSWDGWRYEEKQLECSRSWVVAMLTNAPWYRRQVEDAIEALKQSGTF